MVVNSWEYETDPAAVQMPGWQKVAIGIDVAAAVILIGLEALIVRSWRKKEKASN